MGMTEDEMAGWHHRLDGHELGWTPGVGDGQGGLVCCNSWCCKQSDRTERLNLTEGLPKGFRRWFSDKIICLPMQEMSVWSLGQEDPLEKDMATCSKILAWEIPWAEEPGRIQSMGSQSWTWLSTHKVCLTWKAMLFPPALCWTLDSKFSYNMLPQCLWRPICKENSVWASHVASPLPSMIRTKESRPLLTFPSHIIGPQFVAAITVFVLFTVELQHLGSLIKILLDPFQIVHQPIATCEERAKIVVQVWGSGEGPGVAGRMCLLLGQASVLLSCGKVTSPQKMHVQPLLQMALSALSLGLSNV